MTQAEKAKEVRKNLRAAGLTIREVAIELGVDTPLVHAVLSGRLKGSRGDARRVAVRLGLREERPVAEVMEEALQHTGGAK